MADSYYDEIEIEDMVFDTKLQLYHFPCPCGDRFEISLGDLRDGEDVAVCPTCSLMIKVIFEASDLPQEQPVKTEKETPRQIVAVVGM
ncbi:CSL family zinc finger-containing protein [Patellaria atrata CBS 101060]|uniref:Diphthamide biosynthesis protein 3 n=1 Tax=Patellaria atrata CBS 101060 TaxID=1346257 RepID=A0A9P4SBJ8_9PEZI|nr:CSL family zinc finger-containing protein [Patellaria atrata CBS 101060]